MGYAPKVLQQAGQTIARRRENAIAASDIRRQQLYNALPALADMEQKLRRLAIEGAKCALSGTESAKQSLKAMERDSLLLQEDIHRLLRAADLSEDALEIQYYCSQCQDTGYIGQNVCGCLAQLRREIAFAELKGSAPVEDSTFERFSLAHYPTQPDDHGRIPRRVMERIFQQCRTFADHFHPRGESLLFMGNTGLGKTHLSLAIASEVLKQGYGVLYLSTYRYIDYAERFKFQREEYSWDIASEAQNCDLLILDDLGAEFSTPFSVAALQSLLNQRLTEGRSTIVSTNFNVEDLGERYGERLKSRLVCAFHSMPFCGKDIRFSLRRQRTSVCPFSQEV